MMDDLYSVCTWKAAGRVGIIIFLHCQWWLQPVCHTSHVMQSRIQVKTGKKSIINHKWCWNRTIVHLKWKKNSEWNKLTCPNRQNTPKENIKNYDVNLDWFCNYTRELTIYLLRWAVLRLFKTHCQPPNESNQIGRFEPANKTL